MLSVCEGMKTKSLTSWAASEDISSNFVVEEDEEGVWEGAEPPRRPEVLDRQRERIKPRM